MADKRLIDANALKVRMFRSREFNYETGSFDLPVVPWHDIEDADTIDAAEVVRSRECKHSVCIFTAHYVGCDMWRHPTPKDGFCHMGEKMD